MRYTAISQRRKVYAFEIPEYGFGLSPFSEAQTGKRPINVYASREELETAALERNCEVVWQTN